MTICGNQETVSMYIKRVQGQITRQGEQMGIMDRLKAAPKSTVPPAATAAAVNSAPPPPPPPKIAPAPTPAPPQPAPESVPEDDTRLEETIALCVALGLPLDGKSGGTERPLWANEGCAACKGAGFSSSGKACPVCEATVVKREGVSQQFFEIERIENEPTTWQLNRDKFLKNEEFQGQVREFLNEAVKENPDMKGEVDRLLGVADEQPETLKVSGEVATELLDAADASAKRIAEESAQPDPGKPEDTGKRGRPTTTFTLLINAAALAIPGNRYVFGDAMLAEVMATVAEAKGQTDFFACETWARRDALSIAARECVPALKGKVIAINPTTPDAEAFVSALKPFADTVIMGIR
jgi:hypothetical protein